MSKWINVWHEVNFHTSTGKLTHSGRHSSEHKPRLRFLCSMAPSPEIGPSLCGFNWVVGSFTGCTDTDLYSNMHSCASLQTFPAPAYSSISAQAQSGRSYCPGPASNPQRRGWVTDRVIPKPRMEATNFFPISSRSQLGLLGVEWRDPWAPGCPRVSEDHLSTPPTTHSWFGTMWQWLPLAGPLDVPGETRWEGQTVIITLMDALFIHQPTSLHTEGGRNWGPRHHCQTRPSIQSTMQALGVSHISLARAELHGHEALNVTYIY